MCTLGQLAHTPFSIFPLVCCFSSFLWKAFLYSAPQPQQPLFLNRDVMAVIFRCFKLKLILISFSFIALVTGEISVAPLLLEDKVAADHLIQLLAK
jgi:hypothetical protein